MKHCRRPRLASRTPGRRSLHWIVLAALAVTLTAIVLPGWAKTISPLDQLSLVMDVRHQIVRTYVEEPDQEEMAHAAVRGMIESLEDPYTTYLAPEDLGDFDKQVHGTFSGIGAEVDIDEEEKRLRIVSPLEDSPAWRAGVLPGDIVLEINGESTEDMSIREAVNQLTGEAGTEVTLLVRHRTGEKQTITIVRDQIVVPTVRGLYRNPDNTYHYMIDPQRGIGYIKLSQFTDQTVVDLRRELSALKQQGLKGLILDVRGNPGGLLSAAVGVSDTFLPAGKTVVSVKGRAAPNQTHESTDDIAETDFPLVVLANESSASASEIVTGALTDNDRAMFIGTRTFGKGSVQHVYSLEHALGALKITTAYYYIPSGRKIHRVADAEVWGVDPHDGFYVPMTAEQMIEMRKKMASKMVEREEGSVPYPEQVTPDWLHEELSDPQLAAALTSMIGKLGDGEWIEVGESGIERQTLLSERERLVSRRARVNEALEEINDRINEIDVELGQAETDDDE